MDEQEGSGRGKCILVVEDELFIAMDVQFALIEAGFRVMTASSVKQALQRLGEARPDAAVLDVNLNGEKVTPVASELRLLEVPFVLTTASSSDELAAIPELADALNLGKPTDLAQLVKAVRDL